MGSIFGKVMVIIIALCGLVGAVFSTVALVNNTDVSNLPGLICLLVSSLAMVAIGGYWVYLDWRGYGKEEKT